MSATNPTGLQFDPNDPNAPKPSTKQKVMFFVKKHKTKIIITVVSIVLLIIGYVWWKKSQKKPRRRRSLNGARRRKTTTRRRTTTRRKPVKRRKKKALKGSKVIITRSTVRVRDNGTRLRKMHRIAKGLRKKHPKSKYSTLLKRAATMM